MKELIQLERLNRICERGLTWAPLRFAAALGIRMRGRKNKKKQSSFTTLHGIVLSLAIAAFVGLIFVLVALYYHPPE
jgi:hypothetical protein